MNELEMLCELRNVSNFVKMLIVQKDSFRVFWPSHFYIEFHFLTYYMFLSQLNLSSHLSCSPT